jgi:hypothetical protein
MKYLFDDERILAELQVTVIEIHQIIIVEHFKLVLAHSQIIDMIYLIVID